MQHYIILGRDNCPFCTSAVELMEGRQLPYDYVDISEDQKLKSFLVNTLGAITVPQIFTHIGGFSEFKAMLDLQDFDDLWED